MPSFSADTATHDFPQAGTALPAPKFRGHELAAKTLWNFKRSRPPTTPTLTLEDIPGAWRSGGWTPKWEKVNPYILQKYSEEQRDDAYWAITASWLKNLQSDLGSPYTVLESENFRLLCPFPNKKAGRQITFLELTRQRLAKWLGSRDWLETPGPHVVLAFYDSQEYVAYLAHYNALAQPGGSCGVFIPRGYPHIAVYNERIEVLETSQAQELVRNLVAPLPLPRWLTEGLVQLGPQELGLTASSLSTIKEEQDEIRDCWERYPLKQFWSGQAFTAGDNRQKRAYQLAEVLTRILLTDPKTRKKFADFVSSAKALDGGEGAAVENFGAGLGTWLTQFLGDGKGSKEVRLR